MGLDCSEVMDGSLEEDSEIHACGDDWEQDLLREHLNHDNEENVTETNDSSDTESEPPKPPSRSDVLNAIQTLKDFCAFSDGTSLETLMKLESQMHSDFVKNSMITRKQTSLTTFFGRK